MDENDGMCKKCGYRPIDYSKSRYSILCTSCRKEQINYPIPKVLLGVISCVLALVLVLSITTLPKTMNEYKSYNKIYNSLNEGNMETLRSTHGNFHMKTVDAACIFLDSMQRGQYEFALKFYNDYLVGEEIEDTIYEKIEENADKLQKYCDTCDEYEKEFESYAQEANVSNEDAEDSNADDTVRTALINILNNMLSKQIYDDSAIYYYLGMLSKDDNEAIDNLTKSIEADSNFQESKVELANVYRRTGDLNKAEQLLNEVLSVDSCNCEALRGLAVVNLLNNNTKNAVKFAKEAYNDDHKGYYVYETLIIALNKDGNKNESKKYIDKYLKAGNKLDDDTNMLLDNKMTLEQYYLADKVGAQ